MVSLKPAGGCEGSVSSSLLVWLRPVCDRLCLWARSASHCRWNVRTKLVLSMYIWLIWRADEPCVMPGWPSPAAGAAGMVASAGKAGGPNFEARLSGGGLEGNPGLGIRMVIVPEGGTNPPRGLTSSCGRKLGRCSHGWRRERGLTDDGRGGLGKPGSGYTLPCTLVAWDVARCRCISIQRDRRVPAASLLSPIVVLSPSFFPASPGLVTSANLVPKSSSSSSSFFPFFDSPMESGRMYCQVSSGSSSRSSSRVFGGLVTGS
mmetsp:Transcript_103842/g.178879  ORF Transcript_103842/g.178879 Transcript_103842/m.178879 type:complete len:262 (+) Transcript_103842:2069-2854(+)